MWVFKLASKGLVEQVDDSEYRLPKASMRHQYRKAHKVQDLVQVGLYRSRHVANVDYMLISGEADYNSILIFSSG